MRKKEFNQGYLKSRSTYHEIDELGWGSGQPSTHDYVRVRSGDTLESSVHQATCHSQKPPPQNIKLSETEYQVNQHLRNKKSVVTPSTRNWGENLSNMEMNPPVFTKKRGRSSEYYDQFRGMNNFNSSHQEHADMRSCAKVSAAFCGESVDTDATMTTLLSFESPKSVKTKFAHEDSACHAATGNPDEDIQTKNDMVQCKRSRTAAVHNQSERSRRDRINQRMETLQKLVPNASKTDKASMLDKVIEYVKQLEAQLYMSGVRNMPQMMMPLGMQEQLQRSPLDPMRMGVGLGMNMGPGINMGSMLDTTTLAQTASQPLSTLLHPILDTIAATPTFIPPQLMVPTMSPINIQPQASTDQGATNNNPIPFTAQCSTFDPYSAVDPCSTFDPYSAVDPSSSLDPSSAVDPYSAFLAQSMKMELYNKKEAAVCQQQANQAAEAPTGASNAKHML